MSKKIVKSEIELTKQLWEDGYLIKSDGFLRNTKGVAFNPKMFQYCGKEASKNYYWEPEWLETESPTVGSWCKFWDEEDEMELPISEAHIGILEDIKEENDYPYVCQQNEEGYTYAKELDGSLREKI